MFATRRQWTKLTEGPKAGIWQPGKRELEVHTGAVGIAGTDNGAADIGGIAVGERGDV